MPIIGKRKCFVDRGDPADYDFSTSGFITDGNWHNLDLSTIIPPGTKAVLLRITLRADTAGAKIIFKDKPGTMGLNVCDIYTQVGGNWVTYIIGTPIDVDRLLSYNGDAIAFTGIYLVVKGWWY